MAAIETASGVQADLVHKKNTGKNWIRRAEPYYGPAFNWLYDKLLFPEDVHASDITLRGMQLVRDGGNMVLGQTEPVSRLRRSKSKGVVTWGFILDVLDGIRARRNGESSQEGAMLDLAVDRTEEVYLGLNILLHNWKNMGNKSEAARKEFLDLLMIPTATVLPTIAGAQGRMLDITIPETTRGGGSRFDRALNLNLAFRSSLNGNYETSNMYLLQMLEGVRGAYKSRSESTAGHRTDPANPNTFDIDNVIIDPAAPDAKTRREHLEIWIHFVGYLDKTVAYVTDKMRQAGIDSALITAYQEAIGKQLKGYDFANLPELLDKWRDAFPDEFNSALSDNLTPQALLGIEEQPAKPQLVTVYERQ